jgi:CRISPR-associated protein Csh1
MIKAIKTLGELKEPPSIQIEDPIKDGYTHAFAILLSKDNLHFSYQGIALEQLESDKLPLYLYKRGTSGGPDRTPTSKLTEPKKTFERKILNWFRKYSADEPFLIAIRDVLEANAETIIKDIESKREEYKDAKRALLILKIDGKYIGEIDIFKEKLQEVEDSEFQRSSAIHICSLCGKSTKVSGRAGSSVFAFSTIDKPGFIAGGFKEELAWKNYPICATCKKHLEAGKKFLEEKCNFKFCDRLSYQLVPKFLTGDRSVMEEVLDIIENGVHRVTLEGKQLAKLTEDENDIMELLSEENDFLSLDYLFIKKEQSAERILLLIQDVLPSRLRRIFQAKKKTEERFGTVFTFSRIRTFFSKSDDLKQENDLDKYFLEIVEAVFKGKPLSLSFLLHFFMQTIRSDFLQLDEELEGTEKTFSNSVRDALLSLVFLRELSLVNLGKEETMNSFFPQIYEKYGDVLNTPLKRGIFCLGALTGFLLRKQKDIRGNSPFWKTLKSLRLDEKDFKSLLPRIMSKFEEYSDFLKDWEKSFIRDLEKEIANQLLLAGDKWNLSVDEANFYFACGVAMESEVRDAYFNQRKEA